MKTIRSQMNYDAIIVGARVAGAATGMLLARAGARVLIIDRDPEPADTLSTHALMRPAVSLLAQWGLLGHISQSTQRVTKTQFRYGDDRLDIPVKPSAEIPGLFAPRRWALDKILRDAAWRSGAELRTGLSCQALIRDRSGAVTGIEATDKTGRTHRFSSDLVIGADGRCSTVAKLAAAVQYRTSRHHTATVYTYVDGLPNEGYRWFYADRLSAGLIPTNDGKHCLFAACPPQAFAERFHPDAANGLINALSTWEPDMAANLRAQGFCEKLRRFPGAKGHMRQCAGVGWALVGDAGYFKDPITAHGITDALRDAQLLARAILENGPGGVSVYHVMRDSLSHELFDITDEIASFDWTLTRLKELHMKLNKSMKAEQAYLVDLFSTNTLAA